jgi:hypothetical protein
MNFTSSYDLINGPVHSKAAFDRAVDETTVDTDVKAWAKKFEDRVWGDDHLLKSVTQTGPDTLQFDVTGAKLIADVTIGPASFPPPTDLAHSQAALMSQIVAAHDDYIGAGAFWIEYQAYGNHLRLGAMAFGSGDTVTTDIYGKHLLTSLVLEPHSHS